MKPANSPDGRTDLAAVKQRTREIIERELGQPRRKTRTELFYFCPFHHDVRSPSFCVYPDHFHCFGACGRHGDAVDFVQARYHLTFRAALDYLERRYRIGCAGSDEAVQAYQEQRRRQRAAEAAELQAARQSFAESQFWKVCHDNLTDHARDQWAAAGIPAHWQDFWQLGYADRVAYPLREHQFGLAAALTIPFASFTNSRPSQVVALQYRLLLDPEIDAGRYLFHKHEGQSLGSACWIARPDFHPGQGGTCYVVEGAKKGAVLYIRLYPVLKDDFQVIALPSQSSSGGCLADLKQYSRVIFWLDPEAWIPPRQAPRAWVPWPLRFCQAVGPQAHYLRFPRKPDDAILEYSWDGREVLRIVETNVRRLPAEP